MSTNRMIPSYALLVSAVVTLLTYSPVQVQAVRILPDAERIAANQILASIKETDNHGDSHPEHRRLAVPFPASPDDHLVTNLPLLAEGTLPTKHWAGLLPASPNNDKYLFYWLFAPDTSQHEDVQEREIPLVIWLNGGPGCSSMDGLFLENGPLRFEKAESDGSFKLVAAQHSWHKTPAYMLYIDQPVGTGLSFTTSRYVLYTHVVQELPIQIEVLCALLLLTRDICQKISPKRQGKPPNSVQSMARFTVFLIETFLISYSRR